MSSSRLKCSPDVKSGESATKTDVSTALHPIATGSARNDGFSIMTIILDKETIKFIHSIIIRDGTSQ